MTPDKWLISRSHVVMSSTSNWFRLRFLSALLEEYGDEWCNKLMFQYRWGPREDARSAAKRISDVMFRGSVLRPLQPLLVPLMIRRMVPRMAFAGANENNAPILVASFHDLVALLELHLRARPYLFGGRPSFGDFGLWGQLHQAWIDPTCGAYLGEHGPAVVAWLERMLDPGQEGPFEPLAALADTLRPIFSREVGPHFLTWSAANAESWQAGRPRTELTMDGRRYYQKTFKYPAQTLEILRGRYAAVADAGELGRFLEDTGCRQYLA